jgi:ATP-dependent DNA helicase RecG
VGIYDDIVNIVSCGSYPNSISQADIENGRSDARNRVIANVFKELGLIEQWGSGIARIKSSCLEVGLKEPKIREINDFVDVEFYRPDGEKVSDSIGLLEQEEKILEFIRNNSKITSKGVEELFQVKEARARRILKEMVEKGLIGRLGGGRNTYYV